MKHQSREMYNQNIIGVYATPIAQKCIIRTTYIQRQLKKMHNNNIIIVVKVMHYLLTNAYIIRKCIKTKM